MSLQDIAKGLEAAIGAIVDYQGKEDIKAIGAPFIKRHEQIVN